MPLPLAAKVSKQYRAGLYHRLALEAAVLRSRYLRYPRCPTRPSRCPRAHLAPILCFLLSLPMSAQTTPPGQAAPTTPVFHAQTQLVLLDVLVRDLKTGLPVRNLQREDFRVLDNKHEVLITTFDSSVHSSIHPLALWFVVICDEGGRGERGAEASGWFSGKESLFRPALDDLGPDDRAGVAHWCDNGDAALDLASTADHDAVVASLTETLRPIAFNAHARDDRRGELTLQRLLRMILDEAHHADPQPLPVVLFLHTDVTGMPRPEADAVVDELLETSGFAFGIKDAAAPNYPRGHLFGEQSSVLHYMAAQTGGEYYSVPPSAYAATLKNILLQLHSRYELGFKPPAIDGKRHKLKVEFSGAAQPLSKSTRLHYRPEYIPTQK